MSLTDEQINLAWERSCVADPTSSQQRFTFARAIESAATAPLLERIAELERELEAVRKDAERYTHVKNVESKFAVCKWNDDADEWWPVDELSIDAAIDAAKEHG